MSKPNIIDRAIAAVAPSTAARRLRARAVFDVLAQRGYDGAARGRRTAGWLTGSASAAAEVVPQIATLRTRSRDLVRNNPYAHRAVASIAQNVVGPGIKAQAMAPNKALAKRVEELWRSWAETTACDAGGRLTFAGVQELAMRTIVESGEVLIRRRNRRAEDRLPVPLQLEVLEPDHLDTSRDTDYRPGKSRVVGGIQYDALGRVEGYWLYPFHPGDAGYSGWAQSELRRWDQVAHGYRVDRPGQPRGVPWGAPAIIRLRDLDEFEDAQLVRQKLAACYTAFVTDVEGDTSAASAIPETLEPGLIEALPPGRSVVFAEPPGVETYDEFLTHNLRAVAIAYGVTYESLVGDYSKVNFSSGRMGHLEYQRNIQSWRWNLLIPQVCDRVWRWFLEQAVLAGQLPAEALEVRAKWTPPRREMVDPMKELQAAQLAVRSGFASLAGAIREQGHDPDELLEEIAAVNARLEELGISLDTAPLARGAAASSGTGTDADEPEEEEPEPEDSEEEQEPDEETPEDG